MEHENLMKLVVAKDNLNAAFRRVKRNNGTPGIDGMECSELLAYLKINGQSIIESLLSQSYRPNPVKRVEIPKLDGSMRKLGIPTAVDRMIQQAVAQILTPIYEKEFHSNSFGFRPNKSAQQAVIKAVSYMNEGFNWVVDIDLEKFFDTVDHDKLISLLNKRIKDGRILSLIRKFLISGVMIGTELEETEVGTPQGGNLSPLLANVVLNELDWELEKRGHKFVRYADDCIILVKSRKAAERVMNSVSKFITDKLKLKVNQTKSKIARPTEIKYLGFGFFNVFQEKKFKAKPHQKSVDKVMKHLKELTKRSWSVSNDYKIQKINETLRGWINYFKIGALLSVTRKIDKVVRYRLRMCIWKHWKTPDNRFRKLVKLGVSPNNAAKVAWNHGYARICRSEPVCFAMSNDRLGRFGLLSAEFYFRKITCQTN